LDTNRLLYKQLKLENIMKTTIITIILLLFIVILNSCTKPKEVLTISDEMKDYIMFPSGSYWIYEDTVTGEVDSVILGLQVVDTQKCSDCGDLLFENLQQYFYSSFIHNSFIKTFNLSLYNSKYIYLYSDYFATEMEINTKVPPYNIIYSEYLDTIVLNNIVYKKVRVFENKKLYSIWAHGVGKIKYRNENSYSDTSYTYFILKKYYINN